MIEIPLYQARFEALKTCVLIPTFNNASKLAQVIRDVAAYTTNILVVNDGSTDQTATVLAEFSFIKIFTHPVNKGKGIALRNGFRFAIENGYNYAISIDSDGQHFAKDLPKFLDKLEESPKAIVIGARNMDQASVPGKSSFGNKFSNFWFKLETGITAPDTQSGYRLYPVYLLKNTRFFTSKFEFEIEVLVRSAWKGIAIESVPVTVYYPPPGERISHFRPVKDFTRISILNTFLVIATIIYFKPRDFLRTIFDKKKRQKLFEDYFLNSPHSDEIKAISVAFGVFMGIIPIWGFQLILAIFLAIVFRLSKGLVIVAANISIPPMIPIIIFLSYKMGGFWMGEKATSLGFDSTLSLKAIATNLQQYIYGSITLAITAGLLAGLITLIALKIFKRKAFLAA
ncbi:MAG: DUF2062 domain-containing protein [Gemmatimonadaceae bacterium]|nr:DUF2062 domain-containing protein [Chitinophagaceae bacterium]